MKALIYVRRTILVVALLTVTMTAILAVMVHPESRWLGMSRDQFEEETNAFAGGSPEVLLVFYGVPLLLAKGYKVTIDFDAQTHSSHITNAESFWQFFGVLTINQSYELGFRSGIFCFTRPKLRCDFSL